MNVFVLSLEIKSNTNIFNIKNHVLFKLQLRFYNRLYNQLIDKNRMI